MALPPLKGSPNETPPFESLAHTIAHLERSGIECLLGGSGLLGALGLADRVGDWDLTTDAPLDRVLEATRDLPRELVGPNGIHADHKLRLEGGTIEILVGHAMEIGGSLIRLPSLAFGSWRGIAVASPEVWAAAYHLLDRPAKRDRLLAWMRAHGARRGPLERLLSEPLPADLNAFLLGLWWDRPSSDG